MIGNAGKDVRLRNFICLDDTYKAWKMIAAEKRLTMGNTISFLIHHYEGIETTLEKEILEQEILSKAVPLPTVYHLYRHFDSEGHILYVGVSLSAIHRLSQHSKNAQWFGKIKQVTMESYLSREECLMAEEQAIRVEKPIYNIRHNN